MKLLSEFLFNICLVIFVCIVAFKWVWMKKLHLSKSFSIFYNLNRFIIISVIVLLCVQFVNISSNISSVVKKPAVVSSFGNILGYLPSVSLSFFKFFTENDYGDEKLDNSFSNIAIDGMSFVEAFIDESSPFLNNSPATNFLDNDNNHINPPNLLARGVRGRTARRNRMEKSSQAVDQQNSKSQDSLASSSNNHQVQEQAENEQKQQKQQNDHKYYFPLSSPPLASFTTGGRNFGAPRRYSRSHAGIDLLEVAGQPVFAIADGKVIDYHWFTDAVYILVIDHGKFVIGYGEVSHTASGVYVGQNVKAGQKIAYVGYLYNGNSMLHLEKFSGKISGKISDPTPPFYRRSDLINPSRFISFFIGILSHRLVLFVLYCTCTNNH